MLPLVGELPMFLSARAQAFIDFAPSKFTEMATSIGLQGGGSPGYDAFEARHQPEVCEYAVGANGETIRPWRSDQLT